MIDAFIRSGRVTRLPIAAVCETSAEIPPDARQALAAYRASVPVNAAVLLGRRRVGPPRPVPVAPASVPLEPRETTLMDEFTSFPARPRSVLASLPPAAPARSLPDAQTATEPVSAPEPVPGPAGVGIADITWDAGAGAMRFLLTDGTARLVAFPVPAATSGPAPMPLARPAKAKPVKGSWSR